MNGIRVPIESVGVAAYTIPTDQPESDGTLEWNHTTIVIVELAAAGQTGLGYSYTDVSAAVLIDAQLRAWILGADALSPPALWQAMIAAVRNVGVPGVAATAISAVDAAAWDLKARLLDLPLLALLGAVRDRVPVYGSGGFTSYTDARLRQQLGDWVDSGIERVKMKVGRAPERDAERVRIAREAIGSAAELFVDANGAYQRKQALALAEQFAASGVVWFEEPLPSWDLEGLRLLRDRGPAGMAITAGEYGYELTTFRRMLEAGAVDILQADATRCLGITGFLHVAALCEGFDVPLSAHTAPALHAHVCCAALPVIHVEYFHDHVRIEQLFFDGIPQLAAGELRPDPMRAGFGFEFKRADAAEYLAWQAAA